MQKKIQLDHSNSVISRVFDNQIGNNYLKMSIQSGCAPARPGRKACTLHGSSITQAFGPYSATIFFSA